MSDRMEYLNKRGNRVYALALGNGEWCVAEDIPASIYRRAWTRQTLMRRTEARCNQRLADLAARFRWKEATDQRRASKMPTKHKVYLNKLGQRVRVRLDWGSNTFTPWYTIWVGSYPNETDRGRDKAKVQAKLDRRAKRAKPPWREVPDA